MRGLGAGLGTFLKTAPFELPIAVELQARRMTSKASRDAGPARPAMALHVIVGDAVGDALIAQGLDQPIEQAGGIMSLDSGGEAVLAASSAILGEIPGRLRGNRRYARD